MWRIHRSTWQSKCVRLEKILRLPVSEFHHQTLRVMPVQSLGKIPQNWDPKRVACDRESRGNNPWKYKHARWSHVLNNIDITKGEILRFGTVRRNRAVSDVLCTVKDSKSKTSQEVTWRQVTGHRSQLEACLFCKRHSEKCLGAQQKNQLIK